MDARGAIASGAGKNPTHTRVNEASARVKAVARNARLMVRSPLEAREEARDGVQDNSARQQLFHLFTFYFFRFFQAFSLPGSS